MDGKALARIGAIVFIAVVLTATLLERTREPESQSDTVSAPAPAGAAAADPARRELRRCQRLGEAATRDRDCLAAWSDNRQRFLGTGTER